MTKMKLVAMAAGIAGAVLLSSAPAFAQCVNKAGEGTNTTEDGAKFQAYEIILQTTDFPMWAAWMASSQKIGVAPGYKVSNVKSTCKKGEGLGFKCVVQARLCKA